MIYHTFNFIYLFIILQYQYKIILVLIYITNKVLLSSLLFTLFLFKMIVLKDYSSYRNIGKLFFNRTFGLPSKPTIFISNYPSDFIEYTIPGLFEGKISIMLFKDAYKKLVNIFGKDRLICIDLDSKNQFQQTKNDIQDKINKGYSIYLYPERKYYNRKNIYELTEFRSGIFHIAKELNISITPIIIDHFQFENVIFSNRYNIYIDKSIIITNVEEDIKKCVNIMLRKLRYFKYYKI